MMTIINNIKLSLLIIVSVALAGCSVGYRPYFRNYTGKPVELIFEMDEYYNNNEYYKGKNEPMICKQEILEINKSTYKYLKDSLWMTVLPGNKRSLIVPANSTVLFTWQPCKKGIVYLKQENKFDSISIWSNNSINNQFKHKRQAFSLPVILYYDYR